RRTEDYIDRVKDLLDTAVSDRLRTDKVAVFMSGGVDSPTLAATACEILRRRSQSYKVQAFTTVVDGLDKDERHYANLVAEHLKIPIHFRYCSPTVFDSDWDKAAIHTPEPVVDPTDLLAERLQYQSISA